MLRLSGIVAQIGPVFTKAKTLSSHTRGERRAAYKRIFLTRPRLAIVGVDTGAQPIVSEDEKIILAVNGEIYNHKQLRHGLKNKNTVFKTHSDCEVIIHLVRVLFSCNTA